MPELIEKAKYCSDSGGEWKFDDPEKIIYDKSIKNIQLLTHPIWWTTPSNLSPGEKNCIFLKGRKQQEKERRGSKELQTLQTIPHSRKIQVNLINFL